MRTGLSAARAVLKSALPGGNVEVSGPDAVLVAGALLAGYFGTRRLSRRQKLILRCATLLTFGRCALKSV